jgi:hypothetical protein
MRDDQLWFIVANVYFAVPMASGHIFPAALIGLAMWGYSMYLLTARRT